MAKHKYRLHVNFVAGTIFGLCIGILLSTWCRNKFIPCAPSFSRSGCCPDRLQLSLNIETGNENDASRQNNSPHIENAQQTARKSNNIFIEETDEKGFLFVGVMTAKKYLDSRAVSAYNTWARSINGKVVFFSSEGSSSSYNIPIVSLKNVDDSYPPQKKSFRMLKYMSDNYLEKYEWFMRADDDIFIRGTKLETFLRSVNSSKPQFIGQAGVGMKEEIGLLSLGDTDNYCMGGTGIVLSRETLTKISPHLKYCVGNLYTTHEDVEIGRCVRQYAGIPCTWAFEMQRLFYQNFKEYKGSFVDTIDDNVVQKAITLHPVKIPVHQYRINNHFTAGKIIDLRHKELSLQRDIAEMNQVLNEPNWNVPSKYSRVPSVMTYLPRSGADIIGWEYISSKAIVSHLNVNPRKGLSGVRKEALDNVVTQLVDIINKNSRQRGRTIDFKEVLYGYVQTDPLNGASYILDVLLTYRKHKGKAMTVPVRRHAYLHQTFTQTEFTEDLWTAFGGPESYQSPLFNHFVGNSEHFEKRHKISETVHFILPLAGKVNEFRRFMSVFEDICLKPMENAQLHVVLFSKNSSPDEIEQILQIVGQYQKRYGGQLIEVIEAEGDFARAQALDLGAKQCSVDDLLFCVDVDILLTPDCLNRIRLNTIQGVQVYYPIVFSQYDSAVICGNTSRSICKIDASDFQTKMGYWRQFGYGIAAMYRSDLEHVGGYDTSIQGWGKEDVDLFSKFIDNNITVFRAVDTGMVHAWHSINCDVNLSAAQFQMCVGSKATTLASQRQLAEMVLHSDSILHRYEDGRS